MTRFAFALLSSTLLLGGCHVASNPAGEKKVAIDAADDGKVSFHLPFAHGELKLPQGMLENGRFDIDGVQMIPGGTIHGFNMDAGDKGATVHLAFDAPSPPDRVRSYFLSEFKAKGVAAAQSGDSISGTSRSGDQFVIEVGPAAQGSSGTIVVHSRD